MESEVEELFNWSYQLGRIGWRGLVWVSGEPAECRQCALALWQAGGWRRPCWVSAVPPTALEAECWLPPSRARTRLGGEQDLLVVDAVSGEADFDPDAFGALGGTLRAGGLLLLLTPSPWGAPGDLDGGSGEHPGSRYLSRLARRLSAAGNVARWGPREGAWLPTLPDASPRASEPGADPACLTDDQAAAVAGLVRLRRRRPLVLTADRGRGKTAALGIACARLLAAGERHIRVTAPRPAAVAALFERLERLCPEGGLRGNAFIDAGGGRVEFCAPDELATLAERGEAGGPGALLLVDEAAAIPATLLGQWLTAFPRIAFATTVHGYEGSGRGFALRFRDRLMRQTPDWREMHLAAPIRWAAGDPLERRLADLLLLDAEPPPFAAASSPTLRRWRRDDLAHREPALRDLFGLLVQAHYRTTPGDLRRLLDAPGLRIATLEAEGRPQAVVVCGDEGGFSAALAERVARGERRPPGHLLAQSLAAHAGCREALTARLRRVQRIAVHPERRREGLGRCLLEAELTAAREARIDLLGASFGAEPQLIAFWRALGFRAVRLGLSRETATGEHALMVVVPTSPRGEALAESLTAGFQRLLPALLAFELKALDPQVALALLGEGAPPALSAADRRDLDDVAHGRREPATVRPALQALLRRLAVDGSRDPALAWLVAWAFQGRDMAWLAARLGVSGRRQVVAQLRQAVVRLLEATTAD
ncbi:tRNA(Met) cytidine acetyltransferase [Halomonas campisalis]|uniref:tRNA(Met) cytidine acetyltransferase TmcA n=1 Tax=Billgrantia campisalis TaxID=74661 RepID=A0ABS9PF29_9GAMM|nr:GNAT family N-acetyltransferase [Halomonas campisalis]MCG6659730.1 tRNA(Met) cytidine acetyltransferase [Halomonas campisalis]MDR5864636.1 GNAT family N-acetyltransferase [Halomonas campisalis]